MIIVQTPLRVSFFGGGTDFPSFYLSEGGCVLTSAIDKYIFVIIKRRFDDKLRIGYTRTELVDSVEQIEHELIRKSLQKTSLKKGVEIITMGDIPAGSGLGSSSTVTVGSLNAMYRFQNENVTVEELAREACDIEINQLSKPVGIQDQYIAAYGGLRFFEFTTDGSVKSARINLGFDLNQRLNESLLLFFTGITRKSDTILSEQKNNIDHRLPILRKMKEITYAAKDELISGNLDALGHFLDESWQLKKQLASKISNGKLEGYYEKARAAGAIGGKITGAGGGGFLLLYCPFDRREAVRAALSELREIPFNLEMDGTKVVFDNGH